MGEHERNSDIPNLQSDTLEKGPGETMDKRHEKEPTMKENVTMEQRAIATDADNCESDARDPVPAEKPPIISNVKEVKASVDHSNDTGPNGLDKGNIVQQHKTEKSSSQVAVINASSSALPKTSSTNEVITSTTIDNSNCRVDAPTKGRTEAQRNGSKNVNSCPTQSSQTEASTATTPSGQQSRQSEKEAIVCDDSQQAARPQMVVAVPQQQTVYYQIPPLPSVVTLPVEAEQDICPKSEEMVRQEAIPISHSHLPIQTEDQIIGMVGAIPIIKMQGGGVHYVKEKKGRFSLLQDTPVIPNIVGATPPISNSSQVQNDTAQNNSATSTTNVPPSREQSPVPVVSTGSTVHTVPQTFDGKSAPVVKRKGRFVVTNVKDPGSIIQIQTKSTPDVASTAPDNNAISSQQDQQQHQSQPNNHDPSVALQHQHISPFQTTIQVPLQTSLSQNQPIPIMRQTFQQSSVPQIPLQPVMIQPMSTIQQTYEIPHHYQQRYTHHSPSASQDFQQDLPPHTVQYSSVPFNTQSQQNYVQYLPPVEHTLYPSNRLVHNVCEPLSVAVPQAQQVYHNQQQQQQQQQQQFVPRASHMVQNQPIPPSDSIVRNQQAVSLTHSTATPPTTPGGSISSPMHHRPSASSHLPNTPVPKPPTHASLEKHQAKPVIKKKTTIQGRSGKVPQSFDSNGAGSSIGLGKVFYLLEQMKSEVTDADQCIKTLQTDIKLLRDKNKDLEARNKELETKWREEQAIREKTEMRAIDLRKKLREAKDEIKSAKQNGNSPKEENEVARKIADSTLDKVKTPDLGIREAKPPISSKGITKASSGILTGASPRKNAGAGETVLTVGSSHSHNNISQLSSTPSTPTVKGANTKSLLNPQKAEHNIKEQVELKNGTDGVGRQNVAEPIRRTATIEGSVVSRPNKERSEASHRRVESMSKIASPPLMLPLQGHTNGSKVSGHKHTQSLHDFDPLKSTVPVISIPTPLSFESLPVKAPSTSENISLSHDLRNTYVGQNGLVMPVSFGMTPTAVRSTEGSIDQNRSPVTERQAFVANTPVTERQAFVANDYHRLHEQPFMVVPQQQPIVFNHMTGRMQQHLVDSRYPIQQRSNMLQNHQYAGGSLQQQSAQPHQNLQHPLQHQAQQHSRHSTQQSFTGSTNQFDPFSS